MACIPCGVPILIAAYAVVCGWVAYITVRVVNLHKREK